MNDRLPCIPCTGATCITSFTFTHRLEADFTPLKGADVPSRVQGFCRYPQNPEANWGPKPRAKAPPTKRYNSISFSTCLIQAYPLLLYVTVAQTPRLLARPSVRLSHPRNTRTISFVIFLAQHLTPDSTKTECEKDSTPEHTCTGGCEAC